MGRSRLRHLATGAVVLVTTAAACGGTAAPPRRRRSRRFQMSRAPIVDR